MLKDEGRKGMHYMKMCQCEIMDAFPFFKNIVFIAQNYNKFISTLSPSTILSAQSWKILHF